MDPEPTFTPVINKSSSRRTLETAKAHGAKRVDFILEKGKEYQQRKYEQTKLKDLELMEDPELTFKPKINQRKPPRHQN